MLRHGLVNWGQHFLLIFRTETNLSITAGTDSTLPLTDFMWASKAFSRSVFSVLALKVS